jgi:hypothetical protein
MAYIGNKPTVGNFQICDAISVVNGQAAYTMQVGSVNVIPQSANHMIVSLNGTIQKPNSSFTVSGSTITFASNLVTNDVIDFIQILGDVLDLGVPSDATVTLAKLSATGTKDATTFLRGDNTFAAAGLDGWSSNSGNLLPADASKGIYLGVNSATASNLLNDYEEGSWTPANPNISLTEAYGRYTKIGNLVTIRGSVVIPTTSDSNQFTLSGLPFTVSNTDANVQGNISTTTIGTDNAYLVVIKNNTTMRLITNTNSAIANSACSGDFINFSVAYTV